MNIKQNRSTFTPRESCSSKVSIVPDQRSRLALMSTAIVRAANPAKFQLPLAIVVHIGTTLA